MVLIYYAQVHYLLQTTKERMLLITSKRRMLQIKGKSGWTGYTPYLGGLAQILRSSRYSVNICCLNSGWGSFSKSKSHSSLATMQAWFSTGEPVHGRGFYVLDLAPHWLFQVGAGLHFPCVEWFPILTKYVVNLVSIHMCVKKNMWYLGGCKVLYINHFSFSIQLLVLESDLSFS